jgi:hypothetical protein
MRIMTPSTSLVLRETLANLLPKKEPTLRVSPEMLRDAKTSE